MDDIQILNYILGAIVLLLIFVVVATISIVYARVRVQKSEKELLKKELSHRKDLMKKIVETQEKERTEISNKLHDEIGSKLASIKMILQRNEKQYDPSEYELISGSLKQVISTTRDISHNLSSFILKNIGLVEAAKEIIQNELERNSFLVEAEFNISEAQINYSKKQQIYRIIQELIVNTLRYHSGEKKIKIILVESSDKEMFKFEYIDFGTGIPIDLKPGFGLRNIENRSEIINGQHAFNFNENASFSLKIDIPYEHQPSNLDN